MVVVYAADGMKITGDERARFEKSPAAAWRRPGGDSRWRGGRDQNDWAKKLGGSRAGPPGAGMAKEDPVARGEVGLYFVDQEDPITQGISNFDWKDEVYNQLDMSPT